MRPGGDAEMRPMGQLAKRCSASMLRTLPAKYGSNTSARPMPMLKTRSITAGGVEIAVTSGR